MFDDTTLTTLSEDYPLGFFVCDLDQFDRNYAAFLKAFRRCYPNVRIAYSYKTNYLPALCNRINALGGYAEVVSRMEYNLARRLGVASENIVFNGPVKTPKDYVEAARNGSLVNLEGDYEIDFLEQLTVQYPDLRHRIGIRCAVRLPNETPSRFGFDIDSPDFLHRVDRLQKISGVELEGLHCHMIPSWRTAASYGAIARRLVELSQDIWGTQGPRFIDMGGGYFSNMAPELRAQFNTAIPSFDDYGKAIAQPFAEAFGDSGGPELILEPGLALVADAFHFICRVLDTKIVADRPVALAAGSIYNIRPTKSARNLPLRHIPAKNGGVRRVAPPIDVVGYTCMEDDILHRGYESSLAVNDLLVFSNVGAYTLVLKPPFIQGNVPVLAYRNGLQERVLLKRMETLDDIMATYVLDA